MPEPASAAQGAADAARHRPDPAFPIRLVALDIDGTLIGDDFVVPPRTVAAVAAALARGVRVSLVTGRMTTSALEFARALALVDPIVAYQGALVREMPPVERDPHLGRILRHTPLDPATAREVLEWARGVGLEPHINHLERFVVAADDPRAEDYSSFIGARALVVPDLRGWVRRPVSKILAVGAGPIPESTMADARNRFAGRAAVTISHPRFLEFLAPGVSKAVGVRHLARRARVPLANVLAVGDHYNDLEMIAEVGHGAAMPTAPGPVLAAARYVAPPLEEEGAAQVIERLVLVPPDEAARNAAALAADHDAIVARRGASGEMTAGSAA